MISFGCLSSRRMLETLVRLKTGSRSCRCNRGLWKKQLMKTAMSRDANQLEIFQAKPRKISQVVAPGTVYLCSVCNAPQPDRATCSLHEFREHGVRNAARRYILQDNSCRYCQRIYPSRHHCARHLTEYTDGKCLAAMRCCLDPLSSEASKNLDEADIAVKKSHFEIKKNGRGGRLHVIVVHGPNVLDFRAFEQQLQGG